MDATLGGNFVKPCQVGFGLNLATGPMRMLAAHLDFHAAKGRILVNAAFEGRPTRVFGNHGVIAASVHVWIRFRSLLLHWSEKETEVILGGDFLFLTRSRMV